LRGIELAFHRDVKGTYSDLSVDPSDDCTFWYTQEYLGTDLIFGAWRTRIASFKFPGCRK
jgi:hypothetical protein